MSKQVYVEVVRDVDGEVVERMGPMDEFKAEKVEGGVQINLNHDEYSTRIVESPRS